MNKVDKYYNKLLSIARQKYHNLESLSLNYDVKAIIKDILKTGNEFILSEPYLYCFVLISLDSNNSLDTLAKMLKDFVTIDNIKLIDELITFYDDIFYINEIDIYYNQLNELNNIIQNNQIPLLTELKNICNGLDNQGVDDSIYFAMKDIYYVILAYCILNHKEDNFLEYCSIYNDDIDITVETLLLNGIIEKTIDCNNYLTHDEELEMYILSRIDRGNKKLIK